MPQHTEHILVVEDSEFNALVLVRAVSDLASVTVAKNGAEAFEALAKQDFAVILLDIMLPDTDGFEICRRVIAEQGATAPAIMFVTSLDNAEDEAKGLSLGAVDYIEKPIVASLVRARVINQLNLACARRELLELNEKLTRLATTDSLTGINNRRYFFELMENELERATRYEHDYALMALDLDHFKKINDTFGHERGDAVLEAVASAWGAALRTHDILGRIGGEEFSIFLPHLGKDEAMATADRLVAAARALQIDDGQGGILPITVSIGVAISATDSEEPLTIRADKALYQAKESGRDRAIMEADTPDDAKESA